MKNNVYIMSIMKKHMVFIVYKLHLYIYVNVQMFDIFVNTKKN